MACRKIREWPSDTLKRVSVEYKPEKDHQVCADLIDTFRVSGGYGLSAPQVGFNVRVIVLNASALYSDPSMERELLMINPKIESRKGKEVFKEACFSLPSMSLDIERSSDVEVSWTTLDGESKKQQFSGYPAACVQHEIDHLDGVLTLDRLSQLRRRIVLKRIKKSNAAMMKESGMTSEEKSKQKSLRTRKAKRLKRKAGKK